MPRGLCGGVVNRELVLLQIKIILGSITVDDNAKLARIECIRALQQADWNCRTEYPVENRGDGRRGRVDIEAIKRGWAVGIEIDRKTPRFKSLVKLNSRGDWLKVIATRGQPTRSFQGIDLLVPLAVRTPKAELR